MCTASNTKHSNHIRPHWHMEHHLPIISLMLISSSCATFQLGVVEGEPTADTGVHIMNVC